MANTVTTTGGEQIKLALELAKMKLFTVATLAVEEICKRGAAEGKVIITDLGAVDTTALRESIEGGISEIDPGVSVKGQIGFGKDTIVRGYGSFVNRKSGKPADIKEPTSKYAMKVEDGLGISRIKGPRPFMTLTWTYVKGITDGFISKAMSVAMRRA